MSYDKRISSYKGTKPKALSRRRLAKLIVYVTHSEQERLEELAVHHDTSQSSVMRELLLRELGKKGIPVEKELYAQ